MSETVDASRTGYVTVLSQKNFLALWLGSLVGRTGDYLLSAAMIAFVFTLTGSGFDTGLITAAFYVPIFLFAPYFGRIVDNNDRKKLMILATLLEVVSGLALYFSILMGTAVLPMAFVCVFAISTFGLLVSVCRSSVIPVLVSENELATANSLQQTTSQLSRIFGYALGLAGFVLIRDTAGIVLVVVAAFLASVLFFAFMRFVSPIAHGRSRRSADGLKYIAGNRLFLEISIFLTVANFTGAGMIFLPAIMSNDILGAGNAGFALILVALAAGTIAGNYVVTLVKVRRIVGKIMILSIAANAALYVAFAFSAYISYAIAVTFIIGIVEGISSVPFIALLQAKTPPERMGSVLAGMSMLLLGGGSVSMVLSGGLVETLGVQRVYIIFAILLAAVAALGSTVKGLREASY